MVEVTDKTFSFKDSLRESTKNINNDSHPTLKGCKPNTIPSGNS